MVCSFNNWSDRGINFISLSNNFSVVSGFTSEKLISISLTVTSPFSFSIITLSSTFSTFSGGLAIISPLIGFNLIQFGISLPSFKTTLRLLKFVLISSGSSTTKSLFLKFASSFKNSLGLISFTISSKFLFSLITSVVVLFTDPSLLIDFNFIDPSLLTMIFVFAVFLASFNISLSFAIFSGSIITVTCFLLLSTSTAMILNSTYFSSFGIFVVVFPVFGSTLIHSGNADPSIISP